MPLLIFVLGFTVLIEYICSPTKIISYYLIVTNKYHGFSPYAEIFSLFGNFDIFICFFAALVFVNKTRLSSRLPKDIPGTYITGIGVVLYFIYIILSISNLLLPEIAKYSNIISYPAIILIFIGIVKALLSAQPTTQKKSFNRINRY